MWAEPLDGGKRPIASSEKENQKLIDLVNQKNVKWYEKITMEQVFFFVFILPCSLLMGITIIYGFWFMINSFINLS